MGVVSFTLTGRGVPQCALPSFVNNVKSARRIFRASSLYTFSPDAREKRSSAMAKNAASVVGDISHKRPAASFARSVGIPFVR